MKNRIILPMLLLLFVAAFGGSAIANTGIQEGPGQEQMKALSGKISQVDAGKGLFEVKDAAGNAIAISVNQQTKMTKDGKPISLSDLKAGDTVSVEYNTEGGNAVAKSVTVRSGRG